MRKLINLTDDTAQRHVILFEESEIALSLDYHPVPQFWSMDLDYKTARVRGHKLSLNVIHAVSRNLPFDFTVLDTSGAGLDPYRRDDFISGRCEVYLLEPDDMQEVRDAPVPI